ncbi:glutathione S-transferase N-terminal domain-containing protein [Lonepinella koalarum]|uniref:glutathione S-transferase N-terminal domain-containing protein n=1 Tax=Lonepinella koalarum TaxID=53417 RepID=UPI003F6E16F8
MLKLYYLQGACPLVPHVALHWTKADFEAVRLERGEQKSPAFLVLNPQGTVPLLTNGDWTLSQNIAIWRTILFEWSRIRAFRQR